MPLPSDRLVVTRLYERETPNEFAFVVARADNSLAYCCTVSRHLAKEKRPWAPDWWAEQQAERMAAAAFARHRG